MRPELEAAWKDAVAYMRANGLDPEQILHEAARFIEEWEAQGAPTVMCSEELLKDEV